MRFFPIESLEPIYLDMEQNPENHPENAVSSQRTSNQILLNAKYYFTSHQSLQKPVDMDLQQLKRWHEEYKAADGLNMSSEDAIIQEVLHDTLDMSAVEECITKLVEEIPITNGFCKDCQHLFDNWPDLEDPEVLDPSTGQHWPGSGADWKHVVTRDCHTLVLEAAARNGCRFCALLIQTIKDAALLDTFRKIEARLEYVHNKGTTSLSIQNWGTGKNQLLWMNFPGKVCEHCNYGIASELKFDSAALEKTADTFDKKRDVLETAKFWLDTCSQHHEVCRNDSRGPLPTRLISIAEDTPHLVLTEGWETKPLYATLSHCWGDGHFMQLSEKNYDSFFTMIPINDLPTTFKDAIHIARNLGLEYLWIDSLCIIQGHGEDWQQEATTMSSVYGGSFVNIAASSAIDASQSCFLKPPHLVDGLRASISVNGSSIIREFRPAEVYDMATTKSHLATRAWTLQEKILPPRTIHFGNRGAFWECRTMIANEFLPLGFTDKLGSGLMADHRRVEYLSGWWHDVVSIYSSANLTYGQDKLPALSGIARRIHEQGGGEYLAGMWRKEMEPQLCWQVVEPRMRPTEWRSPSWSWTSVDGRTIYPWTQEEVMEDTYARVMSADMEYLTKDPFGQVRRGSLCVACSGLLEGRFSGSDKVTIDAEGVGSDVNGEFSVYRDCLDDQIDKGGNPVYMLPFIGGETGTKHGVAREGEEDEHNDEDDEDKDDEDDEGMRWLAELAVAGILLRKSRVPGHFERVGGFNFSKNRPEDDKELYKPFLQLFAQRGKAVAESVCAEVIENGDHPDQRYIIFLV